MPLFSGSDSGRLRRADCSSKGSRIQCGQHGGERNFTQDSKSAIRLPVHIAIKALSPAINDPITAVHTLDQIGGLLIRLGHQRLEIGSLRDAAGNLPPLMSFPTWDDFLRLALDEIRFYGAAGIQVMRPTKALVNKLISILPDERQPALLNWQQSLETTVERSFDDRLDKLEAPDEDRQGVGGAKKRLSSWKRSNWGSDHS